MRQPYVDLEPVSAAPLTPAQQRISASSSTPFILTGMALSGDSRAARGNEVGLKDLQLQRTMDAVLLCKRLPPL